MTATLAIVELHLPGRHLAQDHHPQPTLEDHRPLFVSVTTHFKALGTNITKRDSDGPKEQIYLDGVYFPPDYHGDRFNPGAKHFHNKFTSQTTPCRTI